MRREVSVYIKVFFSLIILNTFIPFIFALSTCGKLNQTNEIYTLTQDIIQNSNADCIVISSQNITLDCAGYSISSLYNQSGIYSNQKNTTIKNCIIAMGSGTGGYGIELVKGANNSNIISNSLGNQNRGISVTSASNVKIEKNNANVSCSNCYGAYIYSSPNSELAQNDFFSKNSYGLYFSSMKYSSSSENNIKSESTHAIYILNSNNNLINAFGISTKGVGIYLSSSNYNQIIDSIGISNSSYGIYLYRSSNNILAKNNASTNTSYGIYLSSSNYNNLIDNTGSSYSSSGIVLSNSIYNNLEKNKGTSTSSSYGIYLSGANYNNLTSNIGISNSKYGIYIASSKLNNLAFNTGTSNSGYGIYIQKSPNNILKWVRAEGYSLGSYGIYISNSNNTLVINCLNISGIYNDIRVASNSKNTTFINCSYRADKEKVDSGSELIKKWWYRAYVIDPNENPLDNTVVNIYNISRSLQLSLITNALGFTDIISLGEYVNNGNITNYTDYLIEAIEDSYSVQHRYDVHANKNNLNDTLKLSEDGIPPFVSLISPPNSVLIKSVSLNLLNQSFKADVSDNINLKNATLYIWNSKNELIKKETIDIDGNSYQLNFNETLPYYDSFKWNYYVCDNSSLCSWNWINWTLNYGCKELFSGTNDISGDRVNVVFIGMLYTDKNLFINQAKSAVDYFNNIASSGPGLMELPVYKDNKNKFNFWYVDSIATPDLMPISFCTRCSNAEAYTVCSGMPNTYYINFCYASFRGCAFLGGDSFIPTYGSYASKWPYIVDHEFQHQFPMLRDEYIETGGYDSPGSPNCAPDIATAKTWWGIYENQSSSDGQKVGYYDGCSYVTGNYRPTSNSMMRSWVFNLGLVNEKDIEKDLLMFTGSPSSSLQNAVEITIQGSADNLDSYKLINIEPTFAFVKNKKHLPYNLKLNMIDKEFSQEFDVYDYLIEEDFNSNDKKISLVSFKKIPKSEIKIKIKIDDNAYDKISKKLLSKGDLKDFELHIVDKNSKVIKKLK